MSQNASQSPKLLNASSINQPSFPINIATVTSTQQGQYLYPSGSPIQYSSGFCSQTNMGSIYLQSSPFCNYQPLTPVKNIAQIQVPQEKYVSPVQYRSSLSTQPGTQFSYETLDDSIEENEPKDIQIEVVSHQDGVISYNKGGILNTFQTQLEGKNSERFYCVKCKKQEMTKVETNWGRGTWIWFIFWLLVFFPLAFLPFCYPSYKNTEVSCSKCGILIRKRNFLGL